MTHRSLARPYSWANRILFVTPEAHRDLLRLATVHSLARAVNFPPAWCIRERAELLAGLAQALGYTDYQHTAPNFSRPLGRPTGKELELIRLARLYTRDTNHIIRGIRSAPSNACPYTCAKAMERCFTRHAPRQWRSATPLAATA